MRVSRNVASTCNQSRHKSSPHIVSRRRWNKTQHDKFSLQFRRFFFRPIRGQLDEQRERTSDETRDTPVRVKLSAKVRAQSFSSFSCFSGAHAAQSRDGPRESAQLSDIILKKIEKLPFHSCQHEKKIYFTEKMMRFGDIFCRMKRQFFSEYVTFYKKKNFLFL